MANTLAMLETLPEPIMLSPELVAATIDTLTDCAQTCTECANACLSEPQVADLSGCIRFDLDCADVCTAAVRMLSRHTARDIGVTRQLLDACASACGRSADECARHADEHEHCRICAEAGRACQSACLELIAAMS